MGGAVDNSRERLPAALFAAAVVLTALLAGRSLGQAWTIAPDLGHGWALPWLMGWLVWERLSTTAHAEAGAGGGAGARAWWLLGAGAAVYGLVRLLLEPFPLWPVLLWVLAGAVYVFLLAAGGIAGGRAWVRALAGPLALIFTVIPWPGVVENALILPLREGLAVGVAEVLNLADIPAYAEGAAIYIGSGPVGVDEACGGMRSLQTALMIGWFVGEVARMGAVRRVSLLLLAALAAVAGNFLRALVLTWATDAGGMERLHALHDPAGYIALVSTLVVVAVLGWCWRAREAVAPVGPVGWPSVSWSRVKWALVALVLCAGVEAGVRAWYASAEKPVPPPHGWQVRWPEKAEAFKSYPLNSYVEEMLRPDVFTSVSWVVPGEGQRSGYYIGWDRGLQARNAPFIHSPEICLPMVGAKLLERGEPMVVRVGRLELPFEVYEFSQRERLMYIFRVVWNPDEGRSPAPTKEAVSRADWFAQQWKMVTDRRITVRAQVMAFSLNGAKNQTEARAIFEREIAGLLVPTER